MKSSATNRGEPRARLHVVSSAGAFSSLPKGIAAVLLVAGSAAVLAGTNKITTTVNALITPDPLGVKSVTYSTGGIKSYAAYGVTLVNSSNANIQNAWLRFSTATDQPGLAAPFDPAQLPPKCSVDPSVAPANTGLVCQFSQADLGAPGTSFTLLLPVPAAPAGAGQASLSLFWTMQAGQGLTPPNPSQVVDSGTQALVVKVGSSTDVRTWVPKDKSLLVVDASTGGTSSNVAPPIPVTVGLQQDEVSSQGSCDAQYKKCFSTTVSILDSNGNPVSFNPPLLFIDLFRPGSTINNFDPDEAMEGHEAASDDAHIGNATLIYRDSPNGVPVTVVPCINGPAWEIPLNQDRCVVPSYPVNNLTYEDSTGWHFHVIARKNGIMNW